ncbi:hypothetical protein GALMADRAFT_495280 [Galerina marginata CBS 339.88]|uniref:Uncharacterized protein n=1 Tax=Galerina marginata (strain CBS 339.88) TaxID=685588 RepID=A0A067T6Y5_GALM3|nr:hypothetical protein GALMADRAFT_495280 [Galerina marginata CBS 339.88]
MVSPTQIDVRVLTNGQVVTLERVNCPVSYKELVRRLEDMGHSPPTSFSSLWPYKVQVSTQKSNFSFKGSRIHLDEPLVQFYNESFLPSIDPETKQKTPEVEVNDT